MATWEETYKAERAVLTAKHDDGAADALASAVEFEVECMTYCYGGTAKLDAAETLAELAEAGWRMVRV